MPPTLDRYSYVANSPANMVDPGGFWGTGPAGISGTAGGSGFFWGGALLPFVITENGDIGLVFVASGGAMIGIKLIQRLGIVLVILGLPSLIVFSYIGN